MGKIIDYTYRKFYTRGVNNKIGCRVLTYEFARDFETKAEAQRWANNIRSLGRLARITHEPNASKARINKTGRYLVWVREKR
jgi:hypothetical protein